MDTRKKNVVIVNLNICWYQPYRSFTWLTAKQDFTFQENR